MVREGGAVTDLARRIPEDALRELTRAREVLERPSLLARVAEVAGRPVGWALRAAGRRVPGGERLLRSAVARALRSAADLAVRSLDVWVPSASVERRARWHRRAVTVTGALGGAAGLPGLAVELPVTTVLMLRAIADIARVEGEDLSSVEARLACLEVFALGGPAPADDEVESAYLAVRLGLAETLQRAAAEGVAGRALARLLARIAPRYEAAALEKLVAQAIPVVGALSGAAINRLFVGHFQDLARAHFTVRRLERAHGRAAVHRAYAALRAPAHE